jgi:hypothetical protein
MTESVKAHSTTLWKGATLTRIKCLETFVTSPAARRCLLACVFIPAVLLLADGCQSSAQKPQNRTVLQVRLVEQIRQIEQFNATPKVHNVFTEPVDQSGRGTVIFVVSGERDHHIYIFERKGQSLLERLFGKEPEYDVAFKAVINRPPDIPVNWYMWPSEALLLDADGNSSKELFVRFDTMAADRGIYTFILFARQSGSWRGYVSPYVVIPIRKQFGDVGMYVEDLKEAAVFSGKKHYMQPLSNCGDCWHILPRPNGSGQNFLAIVTLSEGEATASPHRRAMVMYRFTDTGFEQDPNWNAGKVFVTDKRMYYSELKERKDGLIKKGFKKGLLRQDRK